MPLQGQLSSIIKLKRSIRASSVYQQSRPRSSTKNQLCQTCSRNNDINLCHSCIVRNVECDNPKCNNRARCNSSVPNRKRRSVFQKQHRHQLQFLQGIPENEIDVCIQNNEGPYPSRICVTQRIQRN